MTKMIECAEPGCTNAIRDHYWGKVKAVGWFHGRNGLSFCPEHVPVWVAEWRAMVAEREARGERRMSMMSAWPKDINPETGEPYYMTCLDCNYGGHVCKGCGEPVDHFGREKDGSEHGTRCVD